MENTNEEAKVVTAENVTDKNVVKPITQIEAEKAEAEKTEPGFFKKTGAAIRRNKKPIIVTIITAIVTGIVGFFTGKRVGMNTFHGAIPVDVDPADITQEDDIPVDSDEE